MKDISIIIPVYNQVALLKRNLGYLSKQPYQNYDIHIIDDMSSQDYPALIQTFPNIDIHYKRNPKNLGAISNIFNSVFLKTNTKYKISLHEDDVLHTSYLAKAAEIMDQDNKIVFTITVADWFRSSMELEQKLSKSGDRLEYEVIDKVDFMRRILEGKHLMFGSVVYRNATPLIEPKLDVYDVLCDRPFLLSQLQDGEKVALITTKAIFIRDHGVGDHRFETVTENHCFSLMSFYKNNLPKPITKKDHKLFLKFSTNNLINSYSGLRDKKMTFLSFIKKGTELGIIDVRYIRSVGMAGVTRLLFGTRITRFLIKLARP